MLNVPTFPQRLLTDAGRFRFTAEFEEFYKKRLPSSQEKRGGDYIHHVNLHRIISFLPKKAKVLAIGPRVALFATHPNLEIAGCGVDPYFLRSEELKQPSPFHLFQNVEGLEKIQETFDTIVLSFSIGMMEDILESLLFLKRFCHAKTRFIITYYNRAWQPAIKLAESLGFKSKAPAMNWVPIEKIEHFMNLANIQMIQRTSFCLMPIGIPWISNFINKFIANLPFLDRCGVLSLVLGRVILPRDPEEPLTLPLSLQGRGKGEGGDPKISVIVPARNEAGNIQEIVRRIPHFPGGVEIIFIEGGSTDETRQAIQKAVDNNPDRNILFLTQEGRGKKDAVKKGFGAASGDILAVLDADITIAPESLTLFVECILSGKGEFINGSRMVYPMRGKAMRLFNFLGNRLFSSCFSYLLGQKVDDTLCGTKVFMRNDYLEIAKESAPFGDWDPYGDFDLLFGATRLNLKIVDLPVRYNERAYGTTNIRRWRDGMFLLKMVWIGAFKLKFHWLPLRDRHD